MLTSPKIYKCFHRCLVRFKIPKRMRTRGGGRWGAVAALLSNLVGRTKASKSCTLGRECFRQECVVLI